MKTQLGCIANCAAQNPYWLLIEVVLLPGLMGGCFSKACKFLSLCGICELKQLGEVWSTRDAWTSRLPIHDWVPQ